MDGSGRGLMSSRPSRSGWPASCDASTQSGPSDITVLCPGTSRGRSSATASLKTFGWVYPVVAIISMLSAIAVIYGQTVHEGDATDSVM
jgi:hypothetical protein